MLKTVCEVLLEASERKSLLGTELGWEQEASRQALSSPAPRTHTQVHTHVAVHSHPVPVGTRSPPTPPQNPTEAAQDGPRCPCSAPRPRSSGAEAAPASRPWFYPVVEQHDVTYHRVKPLAGHGETREQRPCPTASSSSTSGRVAEGSPAPRRTPQVSQTGTRGQTRGSPPPPGGAARRHAARSSGRWQLRAGSNHVPPRPPWHAATVPRNTSTCEPRTRLRGEEAARPIAPGCWRWHSGAMESPRGAPSPPCAMNRLVQCRGGVSPSPKLTVSSTNPSGSPQRGWGPRAQLPDGPPRQPLTPQHSPGDAAVVQALLSPHDDVEAAPQVVRLHVHDLHGDTGKRHRGLCARDSSAPQDPAPLTCWKESSKSVCRETLIFTWLGRAFDCGQGTDRRL